MCGQTTAGVKLLLRIFKKIGDSCQEEQASYAIMAELIVDNDQMSRAYLLGGTGLYLFSLITSEMTPMGTDFLSNTKTSGSC